MMDVEERLQESVKKIPQTELSATMVLEKAKATDNEISLSPKKKRKWIPLVATLSTAAIATAIVIPVVSNINNLERAISKLNGTYVDMEDVAGFAVWNAPNSENGKGKFSSVHYLNKPAIKESNRTSNMTLDEQYEWESYYDWDPNKANVLVSFNEDGTPKEVTYEMTNSRGQIRQSTLGNAVAVYVSNEFTYVMYVSDSEWQFWKDINFAQEAVSPSGFHVHHDMLQTIVIHNETGKVFPLKDLIKQVSAVSGSLNYTMQATPTKEDYLFIHPMYGDYTFQWYHVVYDEHTGIKYEYVDSSVYYGEVKDVRRDKYGQEFVYLDTDAYLDGQIENGRAYFSNPEVIFEGDDNQMYFNDNGVLKVFGDNYQLSTVSSSANVTMESLGPSITFLIDLKTTVYHLEDSYLYSSFGDVWKVLDDGRLTDEEHLEGSFPAFKGEARRIGKDILAFIDGESYYGQTINGRLVKLIFGLKDGRPSCEREHIMECSEYTVHNNRMIISQNENSDIRRRGHTKFFLINLERNELNVELIAYGYNGGVTGLAKPINEPLRWN